VNPSTTTWRPTAVLPIAMSTAALLTILYHIAVAGTAPQPDEGAAAHVWQLLMAGQLPVIGFYAITWLPRAPGTALLVLAAQAGAALAAMAPVYWLGW
jgi:hypothetical protein